jgi:16S rRNA (cytidine1402-2'-O)-methyltransferase
MASITYLIPTTLDDESLHTIPPYITEAVKDCQAFFTENERTARRFLKKIWKEMVIDDYQWFTIHKAEKEVVQEFRKLLAEGKNIGIISEAGCPGIADPGQLLVAEAHKAGAIVKPLVGPSSILLALMASGLNGQQFRFAGYLPIDAGEKIKSLRDLEADSRRYQSTQVFIETPYRNNQLLETITKVCQPTTLLCVASNLTAASENVRTMPVSEWRKKMPDLHKQPAIFCLLAQ